MTIEKQKKALAKALADMYDEGCAGDYWHSQHEHDPEGLGWDPEELPAGSPIDLEGPRFSIGEFLVTVTRPRTMPS